MRLITSAAIAAMLFIAIPACAAQDEEQTNKKTISTVELAMKVALNPVAIFDSVDIGIVRTGYTPGAARFQKVYAAVAEVLYPDVSVYAVRQSTDGFATLRALYADPAVLRASFESKKQTIIGKIASAAIKGIVADVLKDATQILEKPLPLAAANAGDWYYYSCYESEDKRSEEDNTNCKRLKTFPSRFMETYGVEPTGSSAYALSWLYRRHMEGGPQLVTEWQRIGTDLVKEYVDKR